MVVLDNRLLVHLSYAFSHFAGLFSFLRLNLADFHFSLLADFWPLSFLLLFLLSLVWQFEVQIIVNMAFIWSFHGQLLRQHWLSG